MKIYVILNFLIQFIILLTSVNLFFDKHPIKLLFSIVIIGLIFVPKILETLLNKDFKIRYHFLFMIFCLTLFAILIAF